MVNMFFKIYGNHYSIIKSNLNFVHYNDVMLYDST